MTRIIYEGPPVDDAALLAELPEELATNLRERNGYIAEAGGFHVRGACVAPEWHSLRYAWRDEGALHRLFPAVLPEDIPVAEDCFGDQYLLRGAVVVRLIGETGEIENLQISWGDFMQKVERSCVEFLQLQLFEQYLEISGPLEPGQLLSVYPPLVSDVRERSMKAVPALELIDFLADFARQIANVKDGERIKISVT